MPKNLKTAVGLAILVPSFCCCSTNEDLKQSSVIEANDSIAQILNDYIRSLNETRQGLDDLEITNIERHIYSVDESGVSESVQTRSGVNTFEIDRADFKYNGCSGYAYLTTHPQVEGVYYYTENGSAADTTNNKTLRMMLKAIPQAIGYNLYEGNYPSLPTDPSPIGNGPMLKTEWGQAYPYNMFMPICYCSKHSEPKHCYVGCVNVAVAQVITYCGRFTPTFPENMNISVKKLALLNMKKDDMSPVANFMHEIAVKNESSFGCQGTSAGFYTAADYLKSMGYTLQTEKGEFDLAKINKCLFGLGKRVPVIVMGYTSEGEGHCWVIDGVKFPENGQTQYSINWGWDGLSNGWVDVSVLCVVADRGYANTSKHVGKNFCENTYAIYISDY